MDLKYSRPLDNTEVIKGAIKASVKAAKEVNTVCVHLDIIFSACALKYTNVYSKKKKYQQCKENHLFDC